MIEAMVTRRSLETPDIVVLELADLAGKPLPDFSAGAHIDLVLGAGLTRQYSLSRMPVAGGASYEIGVLRDPQSRGGSMAAHQLAVGTILRISPPRNNFPLSGGPHASLLFGGGIGVTPILAMAEQLHRSGGSFEFHYCVRSRASAGFLERLSASGFADKVFVHFDDGDDAQKLDAVAVFAHAPRDAHAYVCGPGGFISHVLEAGTRSGWPQGQLHREYFKVPAEAQLPPGSRFQVKVASCGALIDVGEHESIAAALRRHGVPVEVSCEAGVCGTCLTGVIEGLPDHRDFYLNDHEKARNDQMMLCCSRARSPMLVLDL